MGRKSKSLSSICLTSRRNYISNHTQGLPQLVQKKEKKNKDKEEELGERYET